MFSHKRSTSLSFQLAIEMEPKVYVEKGKVNFLFSTAPVTKKSKKNLEKEEQTLLQQKPLPKHNKAFFKLKKYFQIFLHIV